MNDTLSFIDNYFNRILSDSERQAFEERCISDPVFAEEVSFYISARDNLKRELHEQKKRDFIDLHNRILSQKSASYGTYRKLARLATLVAACLLIFLGWQLYIREYSPEKLADQYFKNNLATLGKTMDGSPDSIQSGISAYNQQQYQKAEKIFRALSTQPKSETEAIEYLGIVYLATGNFDKALIQFEKLSNKPKYANSGPFYKALTLMKRSSPGDREEARKLLEGVVSQDLPGRQIAENWLKKL